jgi:predicted O-methyltransferase YrrM
MGGTIYQEVMRRAAHLPLVKEYQAGKISRDKFQSELYRDRKKLQVLGISDWWLGLLARFPSDQWQGADRLLDRMHADGLIESPGPDRQSFADFEQLTERAFKHLPDRYTSIFPEECRIAHALSSALKPRSVFVAGSYYGYLAVWLIPGLAESGKMVCCDIDPAVSRLARQNMAALGAESNVDVICEDAEYLLRAADEPIDLLVLDAYGGYDHPDNHYHGKAIYAPLLRAALPRLHKKSLLLVHNADPGAPELAQFFELIAGARLSMFLDTTDHMAVFQL